MKKSSSAWWSIPASAEDHFKQFLTSEETATLRYLWRRGSQNMKHALMSKTDSTMVRGEVQKAHTIIPHSPSTPWEMFLSSVHCSSRAALL